MDRSMNPKPGYTFLPAVGPDPLTAVSTMILFVFSSSSPNAQAEYIIKYLQPHKDFKTLAGYCFAGIKGRIGAAFARALAYRALSCTKDGRRRHYNVNGSKDQANQHLSFPAAPLSYAAVAALSS